MSGRARRALGASLLGASLGAAQAAGAVQGLGLEIARVQGTDWELQGVSARLALNAHGAPRLQAMAARALLPEPVGQITELTLECPAFPASPDEVACRQGTLRLKHPDLDAGPVRLAFEYQHEGSRFAVSMEGLRLAGGALAGGAQGTADAWEATLRAHGVDLAQGLARAARYLSLPEGLSASGTMDGQASLSGGAGLHKLSARLSASALALADGTGLRESAGLALELEASLEPREDGWGFQGRVRAPGGQIYVDPLYLQIEGAPLSLSAAGRWRPEAGELHLEQIAYEDPGVLALQGRARLRPATDPALRELDLTVEAPALARTYPVYLQPWAPGTMLGALESAGRVQGRVQWREPGPLQSQWTLQGVHLDDKQGRFGIYGLGGEASWSDQGLQPVHLSWEGAHFYRIDLGAASARGLAGGDALRLSEPLALPVLDGSLRVDTLQIDGLGDPQRLQGRFEALLTPVSMRALSAALGWPSLGGSLSGVIPQVRYENGLATMDGALLVKIFDGEIVIRDLSLDHPLGLVPRLTANADLRNLDLEQLTGAFSFGTITGRLDGRVHDLVLQRWEPTAFDAELHTPPGDDTRHRISQRAVDSLASLGGAGGVLSRTYLRFFEQFSYDRLALRCRLRNGICEMGGVSPAEAGYYIVKGGGLPRIDIIGYNRLVDWDTLLRRLQDATTSGAPVVR